MQGLSTKTGSFVLEDIAECILFVSSMSMNFFEILTASAKPQNDSGMSLRVITVVARAQPVAISRGNPKPGQGLEVEVHSIEYNKLQFRQCF